MKYTAVNQKNAVTKRDLSEERPLMENEKHETYTGIVRQLWGRENCRDHSTDRLLKASSIHSGLVDSNETEANDDCNGRAMHRGLSAGADCPEDDENESQSDTFNFTPVGANSAWSAYMNRVRSLTNMGQELAHRLATRAENRRQNAQNHITQSPLGYDEGHVSMNDSLRRSPGQEPQVDNEPHNTQNTEFDAQDEPRAPRRLFNQRIPQPRAPQRSIPVSRIPQTRTRNEQEADVAAAPPRGSRMNLQQPVSVSCDQTSSASQLPIRASRIPRNRTCNEQAGAAPPRGSHRPSAQDHAAGSRPAPVSQIPRPGTRNEQEAIATAAPSRTPRSAPQCPIPTTNAPQRSTTASRLNGIRRNNENNARARRQMGSRGNPRIAQRTCPNPRCSIPLSRATPRFHPDSPDYYERRRLSMERFLDECESSYMCSLGSPCETTLSGEHWSTDDEEVPAVTCQPSAPGHPSHTYSGYGSPQPNIPGPSVPQCLPRTSTPPYQTNNEHEADAASQHFTPVQQEQNDAIRIAGTFTAQAISESPRIMEAPTVASHPSPPQCPTSQPELTRCPECNSPNDALYRFLDRVNDNDAEPSPPRRLTYCSEHRPPPPPNNGIDALIGFLNRVHNNDEVPAPSCNQDHRSPASSGYGSLMPNNQESGAPHHTPPSPRYDTYEEALNRYRPPALRQERNRAIQITGSFNVLLEHPAIQDITPPGGYFDLDFSDGTDENNRC